MEPISTTDPRATTRARAYLGLGWPLVSGHRHRPRQGCTCDRPDCPVPGAHPKVDLGPRLTEDTLAGLDQAPGVSLIAVTEAMDAVIVPRRIGMAAMVYLDREGPIPCLTYRDTVALLVLPATGRYAAVHQDIEVRTGPDGWIALPPSHGTAWDTPPWTEPAGTPRPLRHGQDVGRELAEALRLARRPLMPTEGQR
ncbi:hypothetical protein KBP30_41210 [Streptomyces sp. Go40/10]|uniref:hypothetical protein n=1 Tax=Streptomyces sp. Go40/10 TaxID=2825844 RepID=UPI001E2A4F81|nr:hypothetical protein [Streptomyces sp. Go40/10]UFR07159.1 hypothetical protein KBP30_41210 [Streptomyces sp. Go40/10]